MTLNTETTSTSSGPLARARTDEQRVWIGGRVPLDYFSFESFMSRITERVRTANGPCLCVSSVNLDHLHHYGDGRFFSTTSNAGEWVYVADGWPIARRLTKATNRAWPRLAGSDLLPHVLQMLSDQNGSLAMVGGSKEMHEGFRAAVSRDFPGLRLIGTWSPSREELFTHRFYEEMAWELRRQRPDVVLASLPKPVSERWIREHADATSGTVFLAFGAAADFVTGQVTRAPKIFQRLGLEWLFRLLQEPRRLAHRYLVRGPSSLPLLLEPCMSENLSFTESAADGRRSA